MHVLVKRCWKIYSAMRRARLVLIYWLKKANDEMNKIKCQTYFCRLGWLGWVGLRWWCWPCWVDSWRCCWSWTRCWRLRAAQAGFGTGMSSSPSRWPFFLPFFCSSFLPFFLTFFLVWSAWLLAPLTVSNSRQRNMKANVTHPPLALTLDCVSGARKKVTRFEQQVGVRESRGMMK